MVAVLEPKYCCLVRLVCSAIAEVSTSPGALGVHGPHVASPSRLRRCFITPADRSMQALTAVAQRRPLRCGTAPLEAWPMSGRRIAWWRLS